MQKYLNNITAQHSTKPRFMAWLAATLTLPDAVCETARTISDAFRIDTACGPQLDAVGQLSGISRALPGNLDTVGAGILDDTTYRRMMRAKIVKNQWDGTRETISEIWDTALGGEVRADYFDNQDMSMTVTLTGEFDPQYTELILRGYVVPKPAGVALNLALRTEAEAGTVLHAGCAIYAAYAEYRAKA